MEVATVLKLMRYNNDFGNDKNNKINCSAIVTATSTVTSLKKTRQ